MKTISVRMVLKKETRGTFVYEPSVTDGARPLRALYVERWAIDGTAPQELDLVLAEPPAVGA